MRITTPTRKFAKLAAYSAVIGVAPLLAFNVDPVSATRALDGLGRDIGVTGDVVNHPAAGSPDYDCTNLMQVSDYRLPGTKAKKSQKK